MTNEDVTPIASFMHHADPGNKWPLDPQILAQPLGMDGGFSGAWE